MNVEVPKKITSVDLKRGRSEPSVQKCHQDREIKGHVELRDRKCSDFKS
jgi:hypothetical protein